MPAPTPLTADALQQIVQAYLDGMPQHVITQQFRISLVRLAKILTDADVFVKNRGPRKLSPLQEKEVLAHWENGLSMQRIAEHYTCSTEPIKRIIAEAKSLNRLTRPKNGYLMAQARRDTPKLITDYLQGLSMYALFKKYGHHPNYVRRILADHNVPVRDDRSRQGPASPLYTGGRQITAEGYVKVWIPKDSPFASMRTTRGHVLEHRLVMAQHLGRPLFPYETVHHRNGNKQDNCIDNLELWERSHGDGQRAEEALAPHCPTCTCKSHASFTAL